MAISQKKSNRKITGGRYKNAFSKKKANNGNTPSLTRVDSEKVQTKRVLGGNLKSRLLSAQKVNVADPKKKTVSVDEIVSVEENDANRNYIRRNIVTKGAVVTLKSGKKAKISSRPGQTKVLSAVLVE
ncbi:MAG: 30S ribosomal protein S8e [Candidatus Woesearchaeota archaeon]